MVLQKKISSTVTKKDKFLSEINHEQAHILDHLLFLCDTWEIDHHKSTGEKQVSLKVRNESGERSPGFKVPISFIK